MHTCIIIVTIVDLYFSYYKNANSLKQLNFRLIPRRFITKKSSLFFSKKMVNLLEPFQRIGTCTKTNQDKLKIGDYDTYEQMSVV
jgi:hypothetical protein